MHVYWGTGVIAILLIAIGVGFVVARNAIARFALFRQNKYYPAAARQVFGIQTRPTYYLVVGIVATAVGLFIGLGSLRR